MCWHNREIFKDKDRKAAVEYRIIGGFGIIGGGGWGGWLEISPKTNNRGRGFGTIGGWGGGVKNDTIFFWYQCNKEVI